MTVNFLSSQPKALMARAIDIPISMARIVAAKSYSAMMNLTLLKSRLAYKSRPGDLFICSYPKSGTTWVQMILYQLTTDGNMNVPHIGTVIPTLENLIVRFGGTLESFPPPGMIKTHLHYEQVPKGSGKYIYVMRDGLDVAVSYYHHYRLYHQYQDTFDAFFRMFLDGKVGYESWFKHVFSWTTNTAGLELLVVKYEDLIRNLGQSVRLIADFCGIEPDNSTIERVLSRSSFAFMRQHEEKFDVANIASPDRENRHFIRNGKVGDWRNYVNNELQREYSRRIGVSLHGEMFREYRHTDPSS